MWPEEGTRLGTTGTARAKKSEDRAENGYAATPRPELGRRRVESRDVRFSVLGSYTNRMADLMTDSQLLSEFVQTRSADAFAGIVGRYVDLVYVTARRMVGNEHLAQDVAQATFLVLVRKAKGVEARRLPGWLVNATRLSAREAMRSKLCRDKHEGRAAQMRSVVVLPSVDEPTAQQMTPLLDEALARLNETDRTAVVMRFLQGMSFPEVGAAMGSSEEAARKRVERAVEKLRAAFMKGGIAPSVGGLMVVLAAHQAQAAPAGLAGLISATAVSGAAGTSEVLAKGVIAAMKWASIKFAAAMVVVTILVGGIGVEVVRRTTAAAPQTVAPQTVAPGAVVPETFAPVMASRTAGPPFVAKLSNGVAVELIGLAPNPSDGKAWWRPDGEVLAERPYPRTVGTTSRGKDFTPVELAVRVNVPAGVDQNEVKLTPWLAPDWAEPYRVASKPGMYALRGWLRKADTTGILRIEIATAVWLPMTQLTLPAKQAVADTPAGHVELMDAHDTQGQAAITAILPSRVAQEVQVVAIDVTGRSHSPCGNHIRTADHSDIALMEFPLPLADIKEFRASYRPCDGWVEYRNISLVAGAKADVQIVSGERASAGSPGEAPTTAAAQTRRLLFAATLGHETDVDWTHLELVTDKPGNWYIAQAHVPLRGSFPVQDQDGKTLFKVTMVLGNDGGLVLEVSDGGSVQRIDLDRDQAVTLRVAGGVYRFVYPSGTVNAASPATTTKAMILVEQERP